MEEIRSPLAAVNEVLTNNSLDKCQPELVVRNDETVVHNGQVTWIIQNSDLLEATSSGCYKKSPNIKIGSNCFNSFNITIYPLGKTEDYKSFLSVFIYFNRAFPKSYWVQGYISIVDEERQNLVSQKFSKNGYELKEIGFIDCISNSDLKQFLRNNKLIIFCSIKIQSAKYKYISGPVNYNVDNSKEICNYKEIIGKSAKFSDVTVEVGTQKISSHKSILALGIPALRPVLKLEDSDAIKVKDISYSEFKDMLDYIYSGSIKILNFYHACKMYMVAVQFEVPTLRHLCLCYIVCNLTERNILIAQILANDFNDSTLEKECKEFIKTNESRNLPK